VITTEGCVDVRIIHRVGIVSSPEIRGELAAFGVVVSDSGLAVFDVDEANVEWPALQQWIRRRRASDVSSTQFSREEIDGAEWLEIVPEWHHGYPQPKQDSFGFVEVTYDTTRYCRECGVGLAQKAPFQMRAEPKWGRRGVLQLNWVFDEFFVKPEVYAAVFEPMGVRSQLVTNTKGIELKSVVQLVVDEQAGVVTDCLPAETCPRCGVRKYLPVTRGTFPALVSEPSGAMVKTTEYFGSGRSAHKRVLVAQSIARLLVQHDVRGASLRPVGASAGV
jgi:hypothetical protein